MFYTSNDGKTSVQVIVDSGRDTIWTTQKGMAEIFDVDVSGISRHVSNIYNSKELDEESTLQKLQIAIIAYFCNGIKELYVNLYIVTLIIFLNTIHHNILTTANIILNANNITNIAKNLFCSLGLS